MKIFLSELFFELKKNKGALIGIVVICLALILALFAPFIAPTDPTLVHSEALRLPPSFAAGGSSQFFSAPTIWAATS